MNVFELVFFYLVLAFIFLAPILLGVLAFCWLTEPSDRQRMRGGIVNALRAWKRGF